MASSPAPIDEHGSAKPPITASPAFPFVVGLWFAALFGIGSLIVPTALLEQVISATGLPSIIPQMAPPLGITAKGLVALSGAVFGAALGVVLARRIALSRTDAADCSPARISARAPLSAYDELDEDGLSTGDGDDRAVSDAVPPAIAGRRRSLAIEEEERPSDYLNVAPLPGEGEEPVGIQTVAEERASASPAVPAREHDEHDGAANPAADAYELDASAELTEAQDLSGQDGPVEPEVASREVKQAFIAGPAADTAVVEDEASAPESKVRTPEPLAFSPPSMARPTIAYGEEMKGDDVDCHAAEEPSDAAPHVPGDTSEDTVSDKQIFQVPEVNNTEAYGDAVMAEETPLPGEGEFAPIDLADDADGDIETGSSGEGLVQLVQRLGAALDKHREWSAEQAKADKAEPEALVAEQGKDVPLPEEFDPAEADDAAQAMAAFFASSQSAGAEIEKAEFAAKPEAQADDLQYFKPFNADLLTPGDEDEDGDDDDLAASFTLPLGANKTETPAPRPAFDVPPVVATNGAAEADGGVDADTEAEADTNAARDDAGFASLNPFRQDAQKFVRIEEPDDTSGVTEPAVLFPGQNTRAAAAPESTPSRSFDARASQQDNASMRAERPRPSNDDNERALREALMNLQRMGK